MKERSQADIDFLKKFGERIAAIRDAKNRTQKDVAQSIEIEKQNLNRLEAGRTNPTLLSIRNVCEELGVTLQELFTGF